MSEPIKSLYEGLFLVSQTAATEADAVIEHIQGILARAEAEVIGLQKWDERRLAFAIKGQRRGTYFISYFRAPRSKLQGLERDCNLSEQILRSMFLRADHLGETEMNLFKQGIVTFVEKKPETDAGSDAGSGASAPAEGRKPAPEAAEAPDTADVA